MLFSSTVFLFLFLPIVCLLHLLVRKKLKDYVLLLASMFFYAWREPRYVAVMLLIGLSTSGNSRNVVFAMQQAKIMDIRCIALVGDKGGDMQSLTELVLPVPADSSAHIQELHIAVGHLICDLIESSLYT